MPISPDSEDEEVFGEAEGKKESRWPDVMNAVKTVVRPTLPQSVFRRVQALKKLQYDMTAVEAQFFVEVHELEVKYQDKYTPYFVKRDAIIDGSYEPDEEDLKYPLSEESQGDDKGEGIRGVPGFWLTVFKNTCMIPEMMSPEDEPILLHLRDIKVTLKPAERMGFVLAFHFSPNEYFTNAVLTKEYEMVCARDESDPFGFAGPEICRSRGTKIDWYNGKDVTVKTVKKRQKQRGGGPVRTVTKVVRADSFFNFFSPPDIGDDDEAEIDEDTQSLLARDFDIGHYLRERVIPRAVLYYTGEAVEDEEDTEEEDEDYDEDVVEEEETDGRGKARSRHCEPDELDDEEEEDLEDVGEKGREGTTTNDN